MGKRDPQQQKGEERCGQGGIHRRNEGKEWERGSDPCKKKRQGSILERMMGTGGDSRERERERESLKKRTMLEEQKKRHASRSRQNRKRPLTANNEKKRKRKVLAVHAITTTMDTTRKLQKK